MTSCTQTVFESTLITKDDLPSGIIYSGQIRGAYHWKDIAGTHISIISETGEYPSINEQYDDYRDAELFASDYLLNDDSVVQNWLVYDAVKDCPVDMVTSFVHNTFQITDLDRNGIGEIWLMYKVGCFGDVSPVTLKIVVSQGDQKYVLHGRSRVKVSENEYVGGDYKFDSAFSTAPNEFRAYAKQLWANNVNENWR